MAALLAMLSQAQSASSTVETRKALILIGLQNGFGSLDWKLPVIERDFFGQISNLISDFREFGDIVFVQTPSKLERSATPSQKTKVSHESPQVRRRPSGGDNPDLSSMPLKRHKAAVDPFEKPNEPVFAHDAPSLQLDSDHESNEELYLTSPNAHDPGFLRGTCNADYPDWVKALQRPKDLHIMEMDRSAFTKTSLMMTLRSRLVTEVYICGCCTNLSVYSTATEAARYGMKVTLVEDCLAYQNKDRHDKAVDQLREVIAAECLDSRSVVDSLRNPRASKEDSGGEDDSNTDDSQSDETSFQQPSMPAHDFTLLEADSGESEEDFATSSFVRLPHSIRRAYEYRAGKTTYKCSSTPEAKEAGASPSFADPEQHASSGERVSRKTTSTARGLAEAERKQAETQTDQDMTARQSRSKSRFSRTPGESIECDGPPTLGQDSSFHESSATRGERNVATSWRFSDKCASRQTNNSDVDALTQDTQARLRIKDLQSTPLFGKGTDTESQKSKIFFNILTEELRESAFDRLAKEVSWQKMLHQTGEVPRLVCCQATHYDDSTPVYRHPSDKTMPTHPWTPVVDYIRAIAESLVGHTLNHALIQLYRGGTDYISEHSDKTLDIVPGTFIVNVSIGAQRIMRLRTKRSSNATLSTARTTYRVTLPHNSMIAMSLETNAKYLHGINADKRLEAERNEAERAFDGQRISLTFRNIGTFLSADSSRIWGLGATGKTRETARPVINGDAAASARMLNAFGEENSTSAINWEAIYGEGSDVLHLK